MREAGIIKWFGGFNPRINKLNDFGYILRDNQPDLYVNRNHLHCKAKLLLPGTAVSFEVGVNYKNNMEQALKVRLLKNEREYTLIKKCVFSDKKQYYISLIGTFLKKANSSDISALMPKVLSLDKEEKKEIMDSIDLELKQREDIFRFLDIEEKVNVLFKLDENKLVKLWESLELKVKIFILYRLCSENRDMSIVERITEKNLFMRAMLIIAWVKYNPDKKVIAYKKACGFIFKYSSVIGHEDSIYKELQLIFPMETGFKVDVNKHWMNWSILEFIQYCNGTSILEDIDQGNKAVVMLISSVNSFIKRFNLDKTLYKNN